MADSSARLSPGSVSLTRTDRIESARLAVVAALAAAAGAIPLPIVPDTALRRLRGAVAHEVAARRGLSLTDEARQALSDPSNEGRARRLLGEAARYFVARMLRRLGGLGVIPPIAASIEIYALGLLFDRYLDRVRDSPAVRVSEQEAREARSLIDRSVLRLLSPALRVKPRTPDMPSPAEELRTPSTRILDALVLGVAGLPVFLERRLEAAFDEVLAEGGGAWRDSNGPVGGNSGST
jgi:hypothetical protein